jgi:hypothetical protein
MKDNRILHPLAQSGKPSGKIVFIHSDGTKRSFTSCVNRLTGSRMSYFDDSAPSIDDPLKWVKSVFRDIRLKAKVLHSIGDF